jgi:hypothetical protein
MARTYRTVGISLSPRHVRWLNRQAAGPSRTVQQLIERRMALQRATGRTVPPELLQQLAEAMSRGEEGGAS